MRKLRQREVNHKQRQMQDTWKGQRARPHEMESWGPGMVLPGPWRKGTHGQQGQQAETASCRTQKHPTPPHTSRRTLSCPLMPTGGIPTCSTHPRAPRHCSTPTGQSPTCPSTQALTWAPGALPSRHGLPGSRLAQEEQGRGPTHTRRAHDSRRMTLSSHRAGVPLPARLGFSGMRPGWHVFPHLDPTLGARVEQRVLQD